jgi:hypothetical protein
MSLFWPETGRSGVLYGRIIYILFRLLKVLEELVITAMKYSVTDERRVYARKFYNSSNENSSPASRPSGFTIKEKTREGRQMSGLFSPLFIFSVVAMQTMLYYTVYKVFSYGL